MELDNVVAFLAGKASGGGGGGDITVEPLSVTSNNTYTAPSGKAYSPVTVNVPNSYSAADEGKVVDNGALVAQTAHAEVTSNGTIDTTLNNSVLVNVPSEDPYTLIRKRLNNTLTEYIDNEITSLSGSAFQGCTSLTKLQVHNVSSGFTSNVINGAKIKELALPKLLSGLNNYSFTGTSSLKIVDFSVINKIVANCFLGSTTLDKLVLRNGTMVPLENINAFGATYFKSGGTGGTLYVPQSLISSYQGASNWSTILGYTNNQIKSIESTHTDPDAPIDLTLYYADGTPIPTT